MIAPQQNLTGRAHILCVARKMFGSRGFHQTPIADLAEAAQVSVGQIYRLFKSKQEMITAIVQDDADKLSAQMMDIRVRLDAGDISIEQAFEEMLHNATQEKDEALTFDALAESYRTPAVGETINAMCLRFREYIRHFACAANPNLDGDILDAAEELILACLFGLGHRSVSRARPDHPNSIQWSAQMILMALRANAASDPTA